MRMGRGRRGLKFLVFGLVAAAAMSAVVMLLWNRLMPQLFGLHLLSFWQALGLLVLSRVLFGRFGRPGGPWGFGPQGMMMQRWAQMSDAEREQLRARWRGRGCFGGPSGPEASEAPKA